MSISIDRGPRAVRPVRALTLLAAALASTSVWGGISDVFQPYVGLGYTYDDNLLRLSDRPGRPARGDRARLAEVGFNYEQKLSRQTVSAKGKVSKVNFDHFKQLDYNGKELSGIWDWEIGNHLEGKAGASYAQVLAPYTDLQIQERNLRVQRRRFVDAAWTFHPSWRVRGGVTRDSFSYELPIQRVNERSERASEAGLDYLASSTSSVGLVVRRLKVEYAYPRSLGTLFFNDSHEQDELKLRVHWRYSGVTQLDFLGGRVKRKHPNLVARDSSGNNGRLVLDWAPLGKLRFNAAAWREFAAVESVLVSESLNRGASAGATWQASSKVRMTLQTQRQKRRFVALSPALPGEGLADTVRSSNLSLTYAPRKNVQLVLSGFREARRGATGLGLSDYRAKGGSLSASVAF